MDDLKKKAKDLGDQAAFPEAGVFDGSRDQVNPSGAYFNIGGLTKREAFAQAAPPCPAWFEVDRSPMPDEPHLSEDLSEKERTDAASWRRDPCFDLPDGPLAEYGKAIESWRKKRDEVLLADQLRRLAVWPTVYADALLLELTKEA